MRQFQKLFHELKDVVAKHRPGDALTPPPGLPRLDILGRELAYTAIGTEHGLSESPPVVLLHGFGGFFMDWPRVMSTLGRHTSVYAIDLPGWGFSEPHREFKSIENDVDVINEFMTRLNLRNVILCGLSYGAGVAWAAASAHLPRVKSAVLLNPMPTYPLRFLHSPMYRAIFRLNGSTLIAKWGNRFLNKKQYKIICRENLLNERLLDTFYLELAYLVIKQPKISATIHAHARGAKDLDWADWEHRLAGIRMPVSILQGREDRLFSINSASHLHRLIPSSELIEIDDCGHAMVFDQHRRVSDHILRLIGKKADVAGEQNEHSEKTVRQR